MCKASQVAKKFTDAEKDQKLSIGKSQHDLGAFHPPGVPVAENTVCVLNGSTLVLSSIPPAVRWAKFRRPLKETETATFVDTGYNCHDIVRFQNGVEMILRDLANKGIAVKVIEVGVRAGAGEELPENGVADHVAGDAGDHEGPIVMVPHDEDTEVLHVMTSAEPVDRRDLVAA